MTDRELMQQALDALEEAQDYTSCPTFSPSMTQQCAVAAVALRTRLAQPEPEPKLAPEQSATVAEREKVAKWMIQRSYATGHGDTIEDLLAELDWQIKEKSND